MKGNEISSIQLETEKIRFIKLIDKVNFKCHSTAKFWTTNVQQFPILKDLGAILYNIPSSSAYIERFYSISGNVCNVRSGNMNANTIAKRSFLKANIKILNKLSD